VTTIGFLGTELALFALRLLLPAAVLLLVGSWARRNALN